MAKKQVPKGPKLTKEKRIGSKERLRQFLLLNIGKTLDSSELFEASGNKNEYGRRLRELRDEEGWKIETHNDSKDLKPGQWRLVEKPKYDRPIEFSRSISAKLRAQVLDRNGFTCQMCGLTPGDIDPSTSRPARMQIGHIIDKSLGGKDELSNLRTLCSTCNQGAKNITGEKPSSIWLLSQIRKAGMDEQMSVLRWLKKKFNEQ